MNNIKNNLTVKNLYAVTNDKQILKGVTLNINQGEVHAIMGPNGAGKTTLVLSLMGHPGYKIQSEYQDFKFQINGIDIMNTTADERAKLGLFVSFQQPVEITGVSFLAFLRTAAKSLRPDEKIPLSEFKLELKAALKTVGLSEDFMHRAVNEGFSGGEKKRAEIVQLLILKPKFAILDEIDSGLDVDSLKLIAKTINTIVKTQKTGILLITHYQRILHFIKPNHVHVLIDGTIKKSGGITLVRTIEKEGYAAI